VNIFPDEFDELPKEVDTLTQLIAAICERRSKAIALSDRMITTQDLSLAFEHESPKIDKITDNCVAMTAGSALVHEPIFKEVRSKFKERPKSSIYEIAKVMKSEYQNLRTEMMNDEIFRRRGISIEYFYRNQGILHDATVMELNRRMDEFDLDLHIVLVGVDNEGAHIICIYDPGTIMPFDALGFCCVGTGRRHADTTFAYRRYTPIFSLKKALYIAYEAKKRSEMAGGVGQMTDIAVIDENGVRMLSEKNIKELDELYQNMEQKATYGTEIDKAVEGIELEFKTT